MPLTYKMHVDAGLITELSGNLIFTEAADGSSGDQDTVLYLGSNTAGRKLEAASDPGTDQLTIEIRNTTPEWQASTAKALNDQVRTTAHDGQAWQAQGAGTTAATEPTWPASPTLGATIVDNDITWEYVGPVHEPEEIKLATTLGGLDSATAGASLAIGTQVLSGVGNAVAIYIRENDATGTVDDGLPVELTLGFVGGVVENAV